ncbi:MAG: SdiA-regulated family protein [Chitinophagaceae bacterium]
MKYRNCSVVIGVIVMMALAACAQKVTYTSPVGYNLAKPQKFFMPDALIEISGIAFHHGRADSMYAIQDEQGKLFYFHPGVKSVTHAKYGKSGDYEDVAILNETVVVLKSSGSLHVFPFSRARDAEIQDVVTEWKHILPQGEYESLYADNATNQLYVLCKQCEVDKKTDLLTGYIFSVTASDSVFQSATFTIDVKDVLQKAPDKKKKEFRPSAMAKNPRTQQWYIISSVNKMLVITDGNWKVQEVHLLDPTVFHQPEGLAFDTNNNLYISNEGDEVTAGNVLKFVYKSK